MVTFNALNCAPNNLTPAAAPAPKYSCACAVNAQPARPICVYAPCSKLALSFSYAAAAAPAVAAAMGTMPATLPPLPTIQPAPLASNRLQPSLGTSASVTPSQAPLLPASMAISAPASLPAVPAVQSVPSAPVAVAGVLLGDGLAPLPPKLIKRIQQLEFVEMADLLAEAWFLEESTMEAQLRRQKGPVTDILVWVQCFTTFASTLAMAYPDKIAELMAYLSTIVRCHRDYEGPSWVLYDRAFRCRAEATKDMNWSVVNTSLFNLCFGGRARRRQVCLSEQHATDACPKRVFAFGQSLFYSTPHPGDRLLPGTTLGVQQRPPLQPATHGQAEICRLFNASRGNRCRFTHCHYMHICSRCRLEGHGSSQCSNTSIGPGVGKRPRL